MAEGAATAPVLAEAAAKLGVDMPIVAAVNALLADRVSVDEVVERLLPGRSRPSWADQGAVRNAIAAAPTTTIAANSQTHQGGGHFIQKIVS